MFRAGDRRGATGMPAMYADGKKTCGVSAINTIDLLEFASDPAFAVNGKMQVIGWNTGAEKLLGHDAMATVGRHCSQILQAFYPTGEPLCSALCQGRSCVQSGEKWSIGACRVRHSDGQMIPVSISSLVMPLETRGPQLDEAVAVFFMRESDGAEVEAAVIQPLRVFTLGRFGLATPGEGLDVDGWKRKQAVTLLKILVSQLGRPVHRERLIEWLWPDSDVDSGWKRLKVVVSFLREKLRVGGAPEDCIETVGQSYLLRQDAVWVDADIFAALVRAGLEQLREADYRGAQASFEEAVSLYRGDYLEDVPYADWCAEERERLREVHLELLAGMSKCYAEQGLFMEAVQVCRSALFSDPCRESFLRAMLENLVNLDRADWAETQFTSWRHSLYEEYGLQPTQETLQVYQRLVAERRG